MDEKCVRRLSFAGNKTQTHTHTHTEANSQTDSYFLNMKRNPGTSVNLISFLKREKE